MKKNAGMVFDSTHLYTLQYGKRMERTYFFERKERRWLGSGDGCDRDVTGNSHVLFWQRDECERATARLCLRLAVPLSPPLQAKEPYSVPSPISTLPTILTSSRLLHL